MRAQKGDASNQVHGVGSEILQPQQANRRPVTRPRVDEAYRPTDEEKENIPPSRHSGSREPTSISRDVPIAKKEKCLMLELWNRELEKENLSDAYRDPILQSLLTEEDRWGNPWMKYESGGPRDSLLLAHQSVMNKLSDYSVRHKLKTKTLEATILVFDKIFTSPQMARYVKQPGEAKKGSGKYSLQAVAMTLLFLQAKFEEIYPPPMSTFVKWCGRDTSPNDMIMLERLLLLELGWNLNTVTATDYIGWFFETVNADKKTQHLTTFILECSYLKPAGQFHAPVSGKWDFFTRKSKKSFPTCELIESYPSKLALGCLCLSLAYQGKICFPKKLAELVGLASHEIGGLIKELHEQIRLVVQWHMSEPNSTIKKFSTRRYLQIGQFKPPSWDEMVEHNAFRMTKIAEAVRDRES